jgi:hypothetical protein
MRVQAALGDFAVLNLALENVLAANPHALTLPTDKEQIRSGLWVRPFPAPDLPPSPRGL